MRRRLVALSLATTVLVVVSFVVPLALLIRQQAEDKARLGAQTDAQAVAGLVALAFATGSDGLRISDAVGDLPSGTIVVIEGQVMAGEPNEDQGSLVARAIDGATTVAEEVEGGWEIVVPVVGRETVAAVASFVASDESSEGVLQAWTLLALLGLVLVGVAVWVAERLGHTLVAPIEDLAESAHDLAEGDLSVRVEPSGPEEIYATGEAFNYLAERLSHLLVEEREQVADLSHRLRTPLTSLRLHAESLADATERSDLLAQVDRLEHSMNQVIQMVRSKSSIEPGSCDIKEVVGRRVAFWEVLAEEQRRRMDVELALDTGVVDLSKEDVVAVVDILIENVFSHTPSGTGFSVRSGRDEDGPWIEIADEGPGFLNTTLERGVSRAGSTGLGLDIVAKTADKIETYDRPEGGAVIRVSFG